MEPTTIEELLDVEVTDENVNERPKVNPKDAQEKITDAHPRFKEVYGKLKEQERKNEDLLHRLEALEGTQEMLEELKTHNRQLANAIENMNEGRAKDKVVDEVTSITEKLSSLKQARKEARESLDYDAQDKIEEEIDELKEKLREVKTSKTSTPSQPAPDTELVEAFNTFVEENAWFTEDPIMQTAAFTVDALLLKDEKWKNVSPSERYAEVKKRVEKRFGYVDDSSNLEQSSKTKVASVESGSNRIVGTPRSTTVKLSAEEVRMAEVLGISSEQYAKQKAFGGAR